MEAAANARPIVTMDLPGFREWLTHGSDCLRGSSEARRSAEKYHDIDRTSKRLGQIYNRMLEQ